MSSQRIVSEELVEQARRAGGHRTKSAAITAALREYVRRREQRRIVDSFGTIDFDPDYDYKRDRRRDQAG